MDNIVNVLAKIVMKQPVRSYYFAVENQRS